MLSWIVFIGCGFRTFCVLLSHFGLDKRFENLRNCVPHTLLEISSSMVGLKSYGVTFNIYLLNFKLNLLEHDQIV